MNSLESIENLTALRVCPRCLSTSGLEVEMSFGGARNDTKPDLEFRAQVEVTALQGVSVDDLAVFLANANNLAIRAWNSEQSFLGRLKNRLTVANPGYIDLPGVVFRQLTRAIDGEDGEHVSGYDNYLLRVDQSVLLEQDLSSSHIATPVN